MNQPKLMLPDGSLAPTSEGAAQTTEGTSTGLSPRWTLLRPHAVQAALWHSKARFRVVVAGRRSGKTELAKRRLVTAALQYNSHPNPWYVAAAPTLQQAKRIYWEDLKALVPAWLRDGAPREAETTIRLINGAQITVAGMDAADRIEGKPLDGIVLDEYGNMKESVWKENIRPMLSDRKGWAWMIGVPEGINHFRDRFDMAFAKAQEALLMGTIPTWEAFTWESADILDAEEIAAAKEDLDEATFNQEYRAKFVHFSGTAYYAFDKAKHCQPVKCLYDPLEPLILCFDFNVNPGVCVVAQEVDTHTMAVLERLNRPVYERIMSVPGLRLPFTAVIGEVWIPNHSNTLLVCNRILKDWGTHRGEVRCYGDATGGNRGSAKSEGSDWELIHRSLRRAWEGRLTLDVPDSNPPERSRVNSVNSRLLTISGNVSCLVDPAAAPHLVRDLESVVVIEGGSGEINKKAAKDISHISDAFGYYVVKAHPIQGKAIVSVRTY